ncbi:hypothetical protein KR009_011899 [Drosophila setifemur]|nr:hypothetical protein KR009_011899 [Drosophila setifemur]
MKQIEIVLCCLSVISFRPHGVALTSEENHSRTVLPLTYLLAFPGAVPAIGAPLPGIPIRRPQDEYPIRRPAAEISASNADRVRPQSDEASSSQQTNNLVREQFLNGILQGLQNPGVVASDSITSPVVIANTTTMRKAAAEPIGDATDDDYDYIDFKNGSRIKYDLDEDQQPVNKILQPTTKGPAVSRPPPTTAQYYRPPTRYIYYRPIYTPYGYRVG